MGLLAYPTEDGRLRFRLLSHYRGTYPVWCYLPRWSDDYLRFLSDEAQDDSEGSSDDDDDEVEAQDDGQAV